MSPPRASSDDRLRRGLRQELESLQRAGVRQLAAAAPAGNEQQAAAGVSLEETQRLLDLVRQEVAACTKCEELVANRTQTVFGSGNLAARLCFLGEAPGADEDRQGEPFVGRAGRLLTDIIEKGMGLTRSDVYILNVLKCRPPENRTPLPAEADNCRGFLDRQLALIQPQFICCLGAVAAQNLLRVSTPIGKLRGAFYDYRGIRVMCTYHPAYLLRNPAAKKQTWTDIRLLMREMGLPG
ncbi:MAG: uracil-DNA glycosylase [Planctomycetales bacterium]|nr:uracil-DNA glycosylase [Planctomycetales bacterium]NIM07930.1 uracil-DNA glycosylase [Planctomycetales bacterium]NIN07414.1 uracil-DNA glycosylase [Planctomycetales bacterium]NIN76518.1 uracil-DNA glycosylase [Planctomycetales bacterium]NIO33708.1 uracil-DNA glycosylase [Planctomycetales bacterium]